MDQIKIGKFISEERKNKKLTQKQLAEILNISDKTISKWECGNGFPEISLLLPLCNELNITVNELLSGERLSEKDYQKKAEENMMEFIREKEENKKKMFLTYVVGAVSLIAFITLILVVAMYTEVIELPVKVILITIACLIFGVGFYVTVQGERTIGYYKCKHCGDVFTPKFGQYIMATHIFASRRLRCPHCNTKGWCKKTYSKEK